MSACHVDDALLDVMELVVGEHHFIGVLGASGAEANRHGVAVVRVRSMSVLSTAPRGSRRSCRLFLRGPAGYHDELAAARTDLCPRAAPGGAMRRITVIVRRPRRAACPTCSRLRAAARASIRPDAVRRVETRPDASAASSRSCPSGQVGGVRACGTASGGSHCDFSYRGDAVARSRRFPKLPPVGFGLAEQLLNIFLGVFAESRRGEVAIQGAAEK